MHSGMGDGRGEIWESLMEKMWLNWALEEKELCGVPGQWDNTKGTGYRTFISEFK